MPLYNVLDFLGGDVLSSPSDHVLLTVYEVEIAILVHPTQVSGVEPTVLQGFLGALRVAPVAGITAGFLMVISPT